MHEVNEESRSTAIANLHMLMQYATGESKPRKAEDPTVRYQRVLAYMMTGSCVIDSDLEPIIQAINLAVQQPPKAKAKAA